MHIAASVVDDDISTPYNVSTLPLVFGGRAASFLQGVLSAFGLRRPNRAALRSVLTHRSPSESLGEDWARIGCDLQTTFARTLPETDNGHARASLPG